MLKDLTKYLKHEAQLVNKLLELAQKQQKALVNFDIDSLYDLSRFQNDISVSFKRVENQRIEMLMEWFGISRNQAMNLRISQLESAFNKHDLRELKELRKNLRTMLIDLNNINNTNRVLSNRAKHSIGEMMHALSKKGETQVCNVRV